MLLTRLPVHGVTRFRLRTSRREPRGVIEARLDWHGTPLRVLVTHFGLGLRERRVQAAQLARRVARGAAPALVLGLGLGKPVTLINELVRRALDDRSIRLDLFTALTLERPEPASDMERRFLGPALDRLFGDYPQMDYARLLRDSTLPDNISVTEFFLQAAKWLDVAPIQQAYVSANYTHALHFLVAQRPTVALQLLAAEGDRLSLSCNTDITSDLLALRRRGAGARSISRWWGRSTPICPSCPARPSWPPTTVPR